MNLKKILKIFEAPVGPGAIASTAKASGIADPNKIKPGQQIKIPMQGGGYVTSTVKAGDTLSGLISKAQSLHNARAAVAPKPSPVSPIVDPIAATEIEPAVTAANKVQADQTAAVKAAQDEVPVDPTIGAGQNIGTKQVTGINKAGFSEDLNDLMRLSGQSINEKAVSKQQQKFMGMVHAMQKGEKVKGASPELKKAAKDMPKKAAKDYASTKHKGLPTKVSESVMLEAGSNLEHIVTRFKHETKNFLNGAELDDDLYNALYDYYIDNGEMPYGVAKAREGDPYQWVSQHFEDALAMMGHQRQFQETAMPVMDDSLSELARLAGLSESRVDECGDMGMRQEGGLNISTDMSSDGKKNVTISAQGEEAEALMQMLKLAGMGHLGHEHNDEPMVMIGDDDEEEMMEYANEPEEEYQTVDSIIRQGNDLNREKRQYADKPKLGDNPMAEEIVDEELQGLLDSVLIKADEGSIKGGDRPGDLTGTWSADPPEKGKPNVPPPVPMDPVSPAAPKTPSSPAVPRPGVKK